MLIVAKKTLSILILASMVLILLTVFWIKNKFGNPSFEQIMFHILYEAGIANFDHTYIKSYIQWTILPTFISTLVLFVFYKIIIQHFYKLLLSIGCIALISAFLFFGGHTGFDGYIRELEDRTFNFNQVLAPTNLNYFSENYINPKNLKFQQNKKKNIITIYVESFENGYSDTTIFSENLLKNFSVKNAVSVQKYLQAPGTEWTIAGIAATQCAAPLKAVFMNDGNNQGGDGSNGFMKNATCVGDVLKKFGYKNIFMNGSPLSFAGVELFFSSHGYDQRFGKEHWLNSGRYSAEDMNFWGLQDDDLFIEAKLKLDELMAKNEPFNLTLLTINTHGPDGFISKSCKNSGGKSYSDIVKCTALEVSNFVKYVQDKGYDKSTNIIIVGDHLSMPTPLTDQLKKSTNRSIFNSFISTDSLVPNRQNILHFDLAPTILDLAGVEVLDGRFGLGYNIFKPLAVEIPKNRFEDMRRNLLNISTDYMKLWINK